MLFFFELLLFVLVMVTLAIGEFVSRGWALALWSACTIISIGGYFLARGALQPLLSGEVAQLPLPAADRPHTPRVQQPAEPHTDLEAAGGDAHGHAPAEPPTPLDQKWARTLLYNWRRANALLLLGVLATGVWYWMGR